MTEDFKVARVDNDFCNVLTSCCFHFLHSAFFHPILFMIGNNKLKINRIVTSCCIDSLKSLIHFCSCYRLRTDHIKG